MKNPNNKIIDVVILVDTCSFKQGDGRVFMVSNNSSDSQEGSSELTINAVQGDYVRWRIEAIQKNDTVNILEIIPGSNAKKGCFEHPFYASEGWTTRVTSPGQEAYTVAFAINDHGIFSWDPIIHVRPD